MCVGLNLIRVLGGMLAGSACLVASAVAQPLYTYAFSQFAGHSGGCGVESRAIDANVAPRGLAAAPDGTIYFTDGRLFAVRKITPDGNVVTVAGLPGAGHEITNGARADVRFRSPGALARQPDGSLLVVDNDTVRRVMADGSVEPYAPLQSDFSALLIAVDPQGAVYARAAGGVEGVLTVTGGNDVLLLAGNRYRGTVDAIGTDARFERIAGLAADAEGNVYVADGYYSSNYTGETVRGNTIRKIEPTGRVSTLAGTPGTHGFVDGFGAAARFSTPGAMTMDAAGDVLVADWGNRAIRKVTPAGEVTTVARGVLALSLAIDPAGRLVMADEGSIQRMRSDGTWELLAGALRSDPAIRPVLYYPADVARDGLGFIQTADPVTRTVVTLDPSGTIVRVIGTMEGAPASVDGPATQARFISPRAVTALPDGTVFVADAHSIRRIQAEQVTTWAGLAGECAAIDGARQHARFCDPVRLVGAPDGTLYVTEGYPNYLVRRVAPDGTVSTVAGAAGAPGFVDGPGAVARFRQLRDIALGRDGNLYVLDNDAIRRILPSGDVATIPGTAGAYTSQALAALTDGSLIVHDGFTLRRVTPAGEATVVAGQSARSWCQDGQGPGALFAFASAVEAAPDGTLYVADPSIHAIRRGTLVPLAAPTITSMGPPHLGAGPDVFPKVTVFGTNFTQAGLEVRVGGVAAVNVDVISDTVMVVSVPTASAPTLRDLSVTTAAGTAMGTVSYVGDETVTMSASGAGSGAVKNTSALLFGAGCNFAAGMPQGGADPCTVEFPHGSLVSLDAEPAPGSVFTGWSGDCSGHLPCRLIADRALNVSATFALAPQARHFAEGYNGLNGGIFDTRFAVANTSDQASFASVRYLGETPPAQTYTIRLQPRERRDLTVGIPGLPQPPGAFSTVIESPAPLVVERTMTWDHREYGAHGAEGAPAAALTWSFAEGATHSGFDLFYLVLNPGELAAEIEVTYLLPAPRSPIVKSYQVPPGSRFTVWVDQEDERLSATDVSAIVRSTNHQPVVVERAMYLPSAGLFFGAGHAAVGVTAPATSWTFAEGATGSFFDLFLLLANPGEALASVAVLYALPDGRTVERTYSVAPRSRLTIWVDHEAPVLADTAVSMRVHSTNGVPVLAERAMWWPGPTAATWTEAHVAPGATTEALTWDVADGAVDLARGLVTYLLVANTSSQDAQLRVTLHFAAGDPAVGIYPLPAHTRLNVDVANDFPAASGRRFWARLESLPAPGAEPSSAPAIAVERATYWDAPGPSGATQRWAAGVCVAATPVQR